MALERRTGFKPNHANIARFLTGDVSDKIAREAAQSVRFAAQAIAVGEGHVETGEYASGFKTRKSKALVTSTWGPRSTWEVYNDAPGAAPVEFGARGRGGTKRGKPARVLLRAALLVHSPKRGAAKVGRMRSGIL